MRSKLLIITAFFFSLFLQQSALASPQLQTTVSDNSVFLGDLFVLTISIDDNDADWQLDTKPLEKDFTVFRPSQSRSSSYINGKSTQQTKWQVTLQAKRIGDLTIPALQIGKLSSTPIKISVKKPSAEATKSEDNLIFMENSLSTKSVYLEQPLLFTSKIYIAQNSDQLDLLAPTLDGASVTVYGEDKNGETIRNGIRYKTITRQYQISSNKAGNFTISSPLLTGNTRKMVTINDWQNRVISSPFNIRGASLEVQIKAQPTHYQGEWLVSDDVRLIEESALNKQSYHVGEPITRSITLQVASIDKDKLPNLHFNYPKNLRFYPDQDELKAGQANGLIYAIRTVRHAIIADHAGQLTLPEVKLPWWNSQTDKQEFAILPAQTLTILAAEKTAEQIPASQSPQAAAAEDKKLPATPIIVDNESLIYWQISSAILLLALLLLSIYHLAYRRAQSSNSTPKNAAAQPLNKAYLKLQEALGKAQAAPVYQALLSYAQSEFLTLKSLSQLPDYLHLQEQDRKLLLTEIKQLENACTDRTLSWNGAQLNKLIKKYCQQKSQQQANNIMDLNP